ncbi:MAG: CRISPR-associated protein (Cas_Cas02710) [candidate division TA06 bacterium ADurb.Bin417]|uniref:CRISPR-associated protein (Cas_Cas02710) n=1 Tax=candidate division TA06 bacterium ADurb.Bin417 TaxID=1852828 RepID=A0A1V5MKM6_UNCT6|nr:MAG: CRISPR-associated protein (Cas_Cas02710) [candidate division TA06 bacterium ADurb.Bin417]
MGKKILVMTVGGTPKPLTAAIKQYKPDFIVFICSHDSHDEKPSPTSSSFNVDGNDPEKNIRTLSNYKGEYRRFDVKNPDDFPTVYQATSKALQFAREQAEPGDEILADYTGGTKTMSAVLTILLFVLDLEITPSLTVSRRKDTQKATGAIIIARPLDVDLPRSDFLNRTVDDLLEKRLYHPACALLENLIEKFRNNEVRDRIIIRLEKCRAFARWDAFEYKAAHEAIQDHYQDFEKQATYLRKMINKEKNTGYEPVFDLVANAERQAENGNYDNAVSRLYRAVELFAQTRLKKGYEIDTAHLENHLNQIQDADLRESLTKKKDSKGIISVGLNEAYKILSRGFKDDPLGRFYEKKKDPFRDNLRYRNSSKLAHGDQPVSEADWLKFLDFFKDGFINPGCEQLGLHPEYPDLPRSIPL